MGIHYQAGNLNLVPGTRKEYRRKVYIWNLYGLEPIKKEAFSPPFIEISPHIRVAPDNFKIGGYKGRLDSWEAFGHWNARLLAGRSVLPESTARQVVALVDTIEDTGQKIRAIYDFARSKTRYVSVQLGIGGWQPFEAKTVDELGYGDCKALTNYTRALLDVAGIRSHYALVRSDPNPFSFDPDFPSNQFNHVILCVPNQGDTLWLETTSKIHPPGYLGKNTSNRQALLITQQGGKLVNTPHYQAEDNLQIQTADVKLSANGQAKASIKTIYRGLQYDQFLRQNDRSPKEKSSWLYKNLDLESFKIDRYAYRKINDSIPAGERQLEIQMNHLAIPTGNRLFLPLNLLNREDYIPESTIKRQHDILIPSSYHDKDTIRIALPEGFSVEYLPGGSNLKSCIGEYSTQINREDEVIEYIRKIKINLGLYAAEHYDELRAFFEKMVKADGVKAVLVKE